MRPGQDGVAALVLCTALMLGTALLALAATGLVSESQRDWAHALRATQARAGASAMLDWGLAALNDSRALDVQCLPLGQAPSGIEPRRPSTAAEQLVAWGARCRVDPAAPGQPNAWRCACAGATLAAEGPVNPDPGSGSALGGVSAELVLQVQGTGPLSLIAHACVPAPPGCGSGVSTGSTGSAVAAPVPSGPAPWTWVRRTERLSVRQGADGNWRVVAGSWREGP